MGTNPKRVLLVVEDGTLNEVADALRNCNNTKFTILDSTMTSSDVDSLLVDLAGLRYNPFLDDLLFFLESEISKK